MITAVTCKHGQARKVCQACMEIDDLRSELNGWLKENGPGGWIDDLRQKLTAAELSASTWKNFSEVNRKACEASERACAQMREALEHCRWRPHEHNPLPDAQLPVHCEVIDRALSSDCGQGFVRREELDVFPNPMLTISGGKALVYHALKGEANCGITLEALALWIGSVVTGLERLQTLRGGTP